MKKKILLRAPLLTRSGYGEQSRFALRSLRTREDVFDIYIQPLEWGKTSWIALVDEEREWIDKTIEKTIAHIQHGGTFDMSLQVTIPNEWEKLAPVNIGYTAGIETSKVAPLWLQKANETMNSVILVSNHSKNTYVNTVAMATDNRTNHQFEYKVNIPMHVVNYPVKQYDNLPDIELDLKTDFNFLAIAQFGPRKNLNNTIKWFIEEFHDENVGLVIKTNLMKNCLIDRERTFGSVQAMAKEFPDKKCKIYLIHGDMTDEEMHALYTHDKISSLLAIPHGEGFGLPIFEAAYSGLPVVAVTWSGQQDYLVDENGTHCYDVSFDLQQVQQEVVWENVLIQDSMWSFAREQSFKEKMRQCYDDITNNVENSIASLACEYANTLKERFAPEKMYEQFVSCIYDEPEEIDWSKWQEEQHAAQDID